MKLNDVNEVAILVALVVSVAALTLVTIVSGADNLSFTGLRDLVILLGGALAGVNVPRAK